MIHLLFLSTRDPEILYCTCGTTPLRNQNYFFSYYTNAELTIILAVKKTIIFNTRERYNGNNTIRNTFYIKNNSNNLLV